MQAKAHLRENVEFEWKDGQGNTKLLFRWNFFAKMLHKLFNYSAPKVPLLFGSYVSKMNWANLITNAGMAGAAARLGSNATEAIFQYIAIGTSNTAANVTDVALGAEITTNGGARAAGTVSRVTTDVTNDTHQVVLTYTFTGSFTIVEAGLFNAASGVTMLARQVFSSINVISTDTLTITWKIDVD